MRGQGDVVRQRGALEKVIAEADGLIAVFNALLMIARAEAGAGREGLVEGDVAAVLDDVVELYEPVAEEAGTELLTSVEPGLHARFNRELLGQALANLIDNALKYGAAADGAAASPISIAARLVDGRVEISVADRGSGIAAADRGRVLDRFVRLEGSRSRPGSGLGLSLAAAIARLHGGDVRIEDNEPGLRVVLSLPAGSPRAERPATALQEVGSARGPADPRRRALMELGRAACLADAFDRAPALYRPDLAKERLADWRAGLAPEHPLRTEVDRPRVAAVLAALADHSPYLWRLATQDPDRLLRLLATLARSRTGPVPRSHASRTATPSMTAADAMPVLRSAKAEVALLVAMADLGGVWDLDRVVDALTRFADRAVAAALAALLRDAAKAGKIRRVTRDRRHHGAIAGSRC